MTNTTTLFIGKKVFDLNDNLVPASVQQVHQLLCSDEALMRHTEQLRQYDPKSEIYQKLKRAMPYLCGSDFKQGKRNGSYFVACYHLIIDLDHLPDDGPFEPSKLKQKLAELDPTISLMFISPGGKGLKIIKPIARPVENLLAYKQQYQEHVREWSQHFGVEQFVDFSACDATRACFLAHDADAFCNPLAQAISFIKENTANVVSVGESMSTKQTAHPTADHMQQVYEKMQQMIGLRKPVTKPLGQHALMTDELILWRDCIAAELEENHMQVEEVRPISFGFKMAVTFLQLRAEINVFNGKAGPKVVIVPKKGTDARMAGQVKALAESAIFMKLESQRLKLPLNKHFE